MAGAFRQCYLPIVFIANVFSPNSPTSRGAFQPCDFATSQAVHVITELCEGGDLFNLLVINGRFPERTVSHVVKTVAEALVAFERVGLVHRDLKLENIFVSEIAINFPRPSVHSSRPSVNSPRPSANPKPGGVSSNGGGGNKNGRGNKRGGWSKGNCTRDDIPSPKADAQADIQSDSNSVLRIEIPKRAAAEIASTWRAGSAAAAAAAAAGARAGPGERPGAAGAGAGAAGRAGTAPGAAGRAGAGAGTAAAGAGAGAAGRAGAGAGTAAAGAGAGTAAAGAGAGTAAAGAGAGTAAAGAAAGRAGAGAAGRAGAGAAGRAGPGAAERTGPEARAAAEVPPGWPFLRSASDRAAMQHQSSRISRVFRKSASMPAERISHGSRVRSDPLKPRLESTPGSTQKLFMDAARAQEDPPTPPIDSTPELPQRPFMNSHMDSSKNSNMDPNKDASKLSKNLDMHSSIDSNMNMPSKLPEPDPASMTESPQNADGTKDRKTCTCIRVSSGASSFLPDLAHAAPTTTLTGTLNANQGAPRSTLRNKKTAPKPPKSNLHHLHTSSHCLPDKPSLEQSAVIPSGTLVEKPLPAGRSVRMIMGHTIQQPGGINATCKGKAIRVDVGMSEGCGGAEAEILEIRKDREVWVVRAAEEAAGKPAKAHVLAGTEVPVDKHGFWRKLREAMVTRVA
ncbi:unnamed protein product [Closterium sp. NIES-65]|nr:unnamed protein product [Closterium sp. NIES-65]